MADNEQAPLLWAQLPLHRLYILGDIHYNAPNVQAVCEQSGRILVTSQ
jgi:hypothetical protein